MKSMTSTTATVGRDRIGRALAAELRKSPGLRAPALVWELALIGLAVSRTEVNSVLYGDNRFQNDGSTPPRWCLTDRPAPTKPAGGTTTPARARAALPLAGSLRLYGWQEDALAAWEAQGSRGVIEAVTGTGKTMVGLAAAAATLQKREKVCVLVPTRELLDQWTQTLRKTSHGPDPHRPSR
jgi:RNA polymerase primary sigma factor